MLTGHLRERKIGWLSNDKKRGKNAADVNGPSRAKREGWWEGGDWGGRYKGGRKVATRVRNGEREKGRREKQKGDEVIRVN